MAAAAGSSVIIAITAVTYIHVCNARVLAGSKLAYRLTTSEVVARPACCLVTPAAALTASAATCAAGLSARAAWPLINAHGWQTS